MATNVTYPGQNNNAGDTRAKLLTVYRNEMLSAFARKNIALSLVTVKSIAGAKTEQFIITGKIDEASVVDHTAGTDIATTAFASNEVTITVGAPKVVASFVDKFEQKLAQYENRSIIMEEQVNAISTLIDKTVFRGIYATRLVAPKNGQTAAVSVTNTAIVDVLKTAEEKGNAIIDAMFEAQAGLDENDVPTEGRQFVTAPTHYYNVVQSHKAVNRDFNGMDNGSIGGGRVLNIAGLSIIQTNNLPTLEVDGITATNLVGMIFNKSVYGVLKSVDITSEVNYDYKQLGDILTTYYAFGYGSLNPSSLAVIFSA